MTSATLLSRVIPPNVLGAKKAHRLLERNLMVYKHGWLVILSGFFEPLFYLFSIGVGIGQLVGEIPTAGGQPVSYAAFVAPALLAASAMNGAVFESTMNIFFKLKYAKVYDAILATPVGTGDIAVGEITWSLIRGALYAIGFMIVMLAMGLMESAWAIMALPAALLIGFAFGAVGMAATSFMRSWQDFDMISVITLPLFLFSATFYPLSVYPGPVQAVARMSPLYHGVELIRALTLGVFDWSIVGHVAFLVVMGLIGLSIAARRLDGLLLT
ncbi:MAG: ABC transporter permease [Acidimicrobiia bacterium]|nr:ABC transporter permease [Acidimicrobiia bacterium]NNF63042.1 ABC transporter permease [Acidimicrobiia bacterium]